MDVVWLLCVAVTCLTGVTGQGIVIQRIRLANGPNTTSGRVEVQVEGVWGTVCDDGWDRLDAHVVCRMLGNENGGIAVGGAFFGAGIDPIFLDDVTCDGSESSLQQCRMTTNNINCEHTEDAGVVCNANPTNPSAPTTTTTPRPTIAPVPDNCDPSSPATGVRLAGFNNRQGIGIVEVSNGSIWGSVCDDNFDQNAAMVVCRSLCFNPLVARAGASANATGPARLDIILDNVQCSGNENGIQNCTHAPWGQHNCGPQEVASVTCVDLSSIPPQPPSPVLECRDGFLIAAFSKDRDPYLEPKHLTVANPITGSCTDLRKTADNNTVVMRIPFDQCGTIVTYNATHLIYSNVIKYDMTRLEGEISRVNAYRVEVYCEMPRNAIVTRPFDPKTEVVTQKSTGQFIVTMTFFRNNSFTNPVTETPLRLPIGEWLNIALQLESIDSRLKLVVPDCVATPTADINNPINYPLFTNSCRDEPTLTFINLNQTRFGYRYQPFMFVNFPQVFLHCGAFVCLLSENSAECDRSCNSSKPQPTTTGRRKRDAPQKEKIYVNSGPLIVYKLDNSMTVLERVGEPQTYSTTFTLPLPTTTPTPDVNHQIGTSVRVQPEITSTRTDEVSGSGDGEFIFLTSSTHKTTSLINDVTTKKSTTTVMTTKGSDVTSAKPEPSTKGNNHVFTPESTVKTTEKVDVTTTKPKSNTDSPFENTSTAKVIDTNAPADGGFYVERGGNPDSSGPAESKKENILKGYIPAFTSNSNRCIPSIVIVTCLYFAVVGLST